MTLIDAVNNLYATYGKYGLDKGKLGLLICDGMENYGLSLETCYNGLRMTLGNEYNEQELFSTNEVAEMLEIDKQEALKLMQQCGIKPIESVQKSITFLYKPDKGERGKQ